ncbi:MAG: hypothetical protein KDE31_24410, partial [Caldilineaceae bacterium]|nr:hypothetical protein [Caldilineaceae bacterium]
GEQLGENHLLGHSVSLYHSLTHVPLIVRDPAGKLPRGAVIEQPVSTRRVFHTAVTAAGIASPTEQMYALSQLGDNDPDQQTVFAEGHTPQNVLNLMLKFKPDLVTAHKVDQPRRAIWHEGYKLIRTGTDQVELFDYLNDPNETENLAAKEPERVRKMVALLRDFELDSAEAALTAGRITEQDDPQLRRHLRALGYLE